MRKRVDKGEHLTVLEIGKAVAVGGTNWRWTYRYLLGPQHDCADRRSLREGEDVEVVNPAPNSMLVRNEAGGLFLLYERVGESSD